MFAGGAGIGVCHVTFSYILLRRFRRLLLELLDSRLLQGFDHRHRSIFDRLRTDVVHLTYLQTGGGKRKFRRVKLSSVQLPQGIDVIESVVIAVFAGLEVQIYSIIQRIELLRLHRCRDLGRNQTAFFDLLRGQGLGIFDIAIRLNPAVFIQMKLRCLMYFASIHRRVGAVA